MRRLSPRHRYEGFYNKTLVPETSTERSLYVLLHGPEALGDVCPLRPWGEHTLLEPSIEYPYWVFQDQTLRVLIEAFLLSTDDDGKIAQALDMPPDEVEVYREVFFDTKVFRTQLERIAFMQEFPEHHPYKKLYSIALRHGFEALRWHYCQNRGEISPEFVVKSVMTDAYFRSLEHRGLISTSKIAREAAKYAKISIDCARTLIAKSETVDETTESLRLKFEEVRKNRTIEDLKLETGVEKVVH